MNRVVCIASVIEAGRLHGTRKAVENADYSRAVTSAMAHHACNDDRDETRHGQKSTDYNDYV